MRLAAGIDWGRHVDNTAVFVVNYADPLLYRVVRCLVFRDPEAPWEKTVGRVANMTQGCWPVLTDATGVGDALTEHVPDAIGVVLVGNQDQNIRLLKSKRIAVPTQMLFYPLFRRIHEGCIMVECEAPGLAKELQSFGIRYGASGRIGFQAQKGHDDQVFGLALSVFAAEHTRGEWIDAQKAA